MDWGTFMLAACCWSAGTMFGFLLCFWLSGSKRNEEPFSQSSPRRYDLPRGAQVHRNW